MSDNYSHNPPNINFKIKNIQIPHPKKEKERKNNDKNNSSNIKLPKNKKINIKDNSLVIKTKDNLYQLKNEKYKISESLIKSNNLGNSEYKVLINGNNENNSIDNKLSKVKREMENVKENIDKLNKKMVNLKNELEKLEIKKSKIENELISLISNKETLEEMYNIEISFVKNVKKIISNDNTEGNFCEIKISKEELINMNINKFIIQIIDLGKLFINSNEKEKDNFCNSLLEEIKKIHSEFAGEMNHEKITENFLSLYISHINEIITKYFDINYSKSNIKSLIHYLIKLNFIEEQIIKYENFIDIEYKIQKEKIDEDMIQLTLALIFYEKHKHEILNKISKLQEEINEKRRLKEKEYIYEKDNDYLNIENNQKNQISQINECYNYNQDIEGIDNNKKVISNNDKIKSKTIQNDNKDKEMNKLNSDLEKVISQDEKIELGKQNILKNKIYKNYLNDGVQLNENKILRKNKINYNNISEYNNKTNISYNYNFNTNFLNIKPKKRKIEIEKKNILVLGNIFNLNGPKRKKYNSNANIREYITNPNNNKKDSNTLKVNKMNRIPKNINQNKNNFNNKRILNNIITKKDKYPIKLNNYFKKALIKNKNNFTNDESFLTNYKKRNNNHNRILTFKKSLSRTNTKTNNSPQGNNKSSNTSMKNIRNKISNSNLILNINNNINFDSNISYRRIKNISNLLTDNLNDININLNNIYQYEDKNDNNKNNHFKRYTKTVTNSKEKLNDSKVQLKTFQQGKMESFCYFKFFLGNTNIQKFNPLNVFSINPEYYDYYESYISLDFSSGCLRITPKISIEKIKFIPLNNKSISLINTFNNSFYIEIKLKDIKSTLLEKYTKDIIQIQNILSKYNIKANNNFSINKIINKKEINDIKLEQNEKIKAALCNFFPLTICIKNNIKIDLIFINYEQFNIWLKNMNSIVQNNIRFSKIEKSTINNI